MYAVECFGAGKDGWCLVKKVTLVCEENCRDCRFRKPDREVTNGVRYPYAPMEHLIYKNGALYEPEQLEDGEEDEEKPKDPPSVLRSNRDCRDCVYCSSGHGEWVCGYLLMTGRKRPCPPGKCREAGVYREDRSEFKAPRNLTGYGPEESVMSESIRAEETQIAFTYTYYSAAEMV